MLIVLCGKSNSGKGTVAKYFTTMSDNIIHLDIDKIAHQVNDKEVVIQDITQTFGKKVIHNNRVNRKELGKIVFNNQEEMNKLEAITWKYMQEEIDKFIAKNDNKIIILDYIMLPKTKYFKEADLRILVEAPYEKRIQRALIRDNITKELFDQRDNASIEYIERDFDYIINNDDDNLKRKVEDIYEQSIISREF